MALNDTSDIVIHALSIQRKKCIKEDFMMRKPCMNILTDISINMYTEGVLEGTLRRE